MMKKPYTFKLEPELHRDFKLQAVNECRPMVDILAELINQYLKEKKEVKRKENKTVKAE
jgi:hypothetical protein